MRPVSRIADHAELAFDLIWGCIAIGIVALAIGFATLGYDSNDKMLVASNTKLPPLDVAGNTKLPPINVEAVKK